MLICWCSESVTYVQSLENVRDLRIILVHVFIRYEKKKKRYLSNAAECPTVADFVVAAVKDGAE